MKRKQLVDASALEAVVAEDPSDTARWSVLEDFLLEQGDPRATVIKARKGKAAELALAKLMPLLFGKAHKTILNRFFVVPTWRAGYLRRLEYFERWPPVEDQHLETVFGGPATRLLEALRYTPAEGGARVQRFTASLPARAFAASLRDLRMVLAAEFENGPLEYDLAPIARLPRLERLAIDGYLRRPKYQAGLAKLHTLAIAPADLPALRALFPTNGYPRLRDLSIGLGGIQREKPLTAKQLGAIAETVFSGRATPALEILRIHNWGSRTVLFDALAESPLLPRLRELHFPAYQQTSFDPKRLGKAFAHLARVVVPRNDRPGVDGASPDFG